MEGDKSSPLTPYRAQLFTPKSPERTGQLERSPPAACAPRAAAPSRNPSAASGSAKVAKSALNDDTIAALSIAEGSGGASPSLGKLTAEQQAAVHSAAKYLLANAKSCCDDSGETPREATSYPRVFSTPGKQEELDFKIKELKAFHGPLLKKAAQQRAAGEITSDDTAQFGRRALEGLVDTFKGLSFDVPGAQLEITYLERGNMDYVTRGISAGLDAEEIVTFVANCPQGTQTLLMLFLGVDTDGKPCPTCVNLSVGLSAGAYDDVEQAKSVAQSLDFSELMQMAVPLLDADRTPLCPKLDGAKQDICVECQPPWLTPPGNSCVDYLLWVTKMLGIRNTVVALGNEAGKWAFGTEFARVAQGKYGIHNTADLREGVRPLVDTIIFESHPAEWMNMLHDAVFMRKFVVSMSHPLAVIYGEDKAVVQRRLETNLPAVMCYMKPGRGGTGVSSEGMEGFPPDVVEAWCRKGGLAGIKAHTKALGLDPENSEHRHVAAVVLGIASFRAVVARRGKDPNNPEDRSEVGREVMHHVREGRLLKEGIDPEDMKAVLKAMRQWMDHALAKAREGRLLKEGVDISNLLAVYEAMVRWAEHMRHRRLLKAGVDLSDDAAVKKEMERWAAQAVETGMLNAGVNPDNPEEVKQYHTKNTEKARAALDLKRKEAAKVKKPAIKKSKKIANFRKQFRRQGGGQW